jgi:hypothetical protein
MQPAQLHSWRVIMLDGLQGQFFLLTQAQLRQWESVCRRARVSMGELSATPEPVLDSGLLKELQVRGQKGPGSAGPTTAFGRCRCTVSVFFPDTFLPLARQEYWGKSPCCRTWNTFALQL